MIRAILHPIEFVKQDYGRAFCSLFLMFSIGWIFGWMFWFTDLDIIAISLLLISFFGFILFIVCFIILIVEESQKRRIDKEKAQQKENNERLSSSRTNGRS